MHVNVALGIDGQQYSKAIGKNVYGTEAEERV
jgi:hypothetical protein